MALSRYIYLRIPAYILTILLYAGNGLYMQLRSMTQATDDERVIRFGEMQWRYYTCWNFIVILVHSILGLTCDLLTLWKNKSGLQEFQKNLHYIKNLLFSSVLFPCTFMVFTLFWALFSYDRDLVLPAFVDKFLTSTSNHIIHTFIIVVALWETIIYPRSPPKSHAINLLILIAYHITYLITLFYTYYQKGFWLYPIAGIFHGTIYMPLSICIVLVLGLLFYHLQWQISYVVWKEHKITNKKIH